MRPTLFPPLAALVLGLAACAGAPPRPALEVSADGRTAVHRGQAWRAEDGIVFFQRGQELHAVSERPDRPFDLKAEHAADGTLRWPEDPRLDFSGMTVRFRPVLSSVAGRVAAGQLYPHEDHLHLTHLYDNADLQALYKAREDGSPYPPVRRQVAAALVALLVEEKLPAGTDAAATAGLARIDRVLARLHRSFLAGLPAAAMADILSHDFEILEGGRAVVVEDRTFQAADGIRFAYCSGHFHVEDAQARWAAPVEFGAPGTTFAFPTSPFYAASADGLVVPLPGPKLWRDLLDSGQIQMLRDHWHLTPKFADPSFDRLRALSEDPAGTDASRARARDTVFELMRLKLDISTGTAFEASVAAVRQAAALALAELAAPAPAPAPRPGDDPAKAKKKK